jgi:hypothetical protein
VGAPIRGEVEGDRFALGIVGEDATPLCTVRSNSIDSRNVRKVPKEIEEEKRMKDVS